MAPRRGARSGGLPYLVLAENLVRRRVLPAVFGGVPPLVLGGAGAAAPPPPRVRQPPVPTSATEVWALLRPLPTHYSGNEAMRRALHRVVAAYVPFFAACAGGELTLRATRCGAGVFAASALAAGAPLPLPGLLAERLSAARYDALARRHRAFSVVQLARRRPLRRHAPIWRLCVGPLSLLNAGCAQHARVRCRQRARVSVWRAAVLLAGGARRGQELLTRYGDPDAPWACPVPRCRAQFRG
jgi:hypothetical protein